MARQTELEKIDARRSELEKMVDRANDQIDGWNREDERLRKRRLWLLSDPDLQTPEPTWAVVRGGVAEVDDHPLPPEAADGGDPEPDPWEYPGPEGPALDTDPT